MPKQPSTSPHRTTSVYRLFDAEDALLYVGITCFGISRLGTHAREKDWWPGVVRAEFEHYPTRLAAAQREAQLIREQRPRHNAATPSLERLQRDPTYGQPRVVPSEYMTVVDAAFLLGIPTAQLHDWIDIGVFAAEMLGKGRHRQRLVPRAVVDAELARARRWRPER